MKNSILKTSKNVVVLFCLLNLVCATQMIGQPTKTIQKPVQTTVQKPIQSVYVPPTEIPTQAPINVIIQRPPVFNRIWSDWAKTDVPNMEYHYSTTYKEGLVSIEVRNTGNEIIEGEFTANRCATANEWYAAKIAPNAKVTFNYPTNGCDGFYWWFRLWSGWNKLSSDPNISFRWLNQGNIVKVQFKNMGPADKRIDFCANYCNRKSASNYFTKEIMLYTSLYGGDHIAYRDINISENCNAGLHFWYENLRNPQKIDNGTRLNPVD